MNKIQKCWNELHHPSASFYVEFWPFFTLSFHCFSQKYLMSMVKTYTFLIFYFSISRKWGETFDGHLPHCLSSGRASVSHPGPSKARPVASQFHDHSLQTSRQTGRGRWWWYRELQGRDPQQPESSQHPPGSTSEMCSPRSVIHNPVPGVFPVLTSLTVPTPRHLLSSCRFQLIDG